MLAVALAKELVQRMNTRVSNRDKRVKLIVFKSIE